MRASPSGRQRLPRVTLPVLLGGVAATALVLLLAVPLVALVVRTLQMGALGPALRNPTVLAALRLSLITSGASLAIALLLVASLGIGLVVAVISDSERQAVQLCLLLLLASVFFSGFVVAISEFAEPVRVLAFALPVTHGIRLIQDIMLRGTTTQLWEFAALAGIAAVTLFAAWIGLRRGMTRA